jgi:hypothetical protein
MNRFKVVLITGLVVGTATAAIGPLARSQDTPSVARASFQPNGNLTLPVGYRHWVHIGTRYKPIGINILDGLPTKTPEILNAYVEPSAMAAFEKTGRWADGTQIVKEFSAIRTGPGCDEKSWVCQSPLGAGIFEDHYIGLGMMVKDLKRFPDAPGHWGYFSFGHKPLPYDRVAALRPLAKCAACHVKLASGTDYVIRQAHLGLQKSFDEGQ